MNSLNAYKNDLNDILNQGITLDFEVIIESCI